MLSRVALRCLRARCACALLCIHHTCMRYMRVCLLLAMYVLRIYVLLLVPALAYIFFLASFFFPCLYMLRVCVLLLSCLLALAVRFLYFLHCQQQLACLPQLVHSRHNLQSAYVRIRQHASAYVSMREHASAYVSIRQHASAYVFSRRNLLHRTADCTHIFVICSKAGLIQ